MSGLADAGTAAMTASNGVTITINDDGSVNFDEPQPFQRKDRSKENFGQNLAETLDDGALTDIANDYLDGVEADILSRSEFIQNYNRGIDLLGLKLDEPSTVRGNRTSISKIKNPSLLKACMRSQSMSRGQLLPAAGPAKIQTISGETDGEDDIAQKMGQDFNYYLTKVDKGYYPDMDRALFYRAFGGSVYKKVYRDPILKRPISRFIPLENLIVSEDATDLCDAQRKTNELLYSRVQVRQMQLSGGWLDIPLGQPMMNLNPARRKVLESQGLSAATTRSQDISHTIYEGYWTFAPEDYGFDDPFVRGERPAPYKVVIDKDSRKVLALHRNWKKEDEDYTEKQVFVKYGLVPGLGFLDYGFLHLIGNQTRVLTAIWQILVDKGMLGNFPGGLKVKGVRTATNELNPSLGEWAEVDIGSMDDIRKSLMAMPYGEISSVFIELMKEIQADVDALSGTLEIPMGQGSTNTPVGTILAMIEQQAQDLTAVQQRDHRAQEEELGLIRALFLEYPEDMKHMQRKGSNRSMQDLAQEFEDMDLVPASDPNIPSQAHRILINQFIVSLAEKAPDLFGSHLRKVAKRVLLGVGVNDAEDLLAPLPEFLQALNAGKQAKGGKAAPGAAAAAKAQLELPLKQAELAVEEKKVAILDKDTQRKAATEAATAELDKQKTQAEIEKTQADIIHDRATILSEHQQGMADTAQSGEDPAQAAADLEKTRAQAFSAVGMGAQGLAKAQETIEQGARDAAAIEAGETPPSETRTASLAGNSTPATPSAKPLKKTANRTKPKKSKAGS